MARIHTFTDFGLLVNNPPSTLVTHPYGPITNFENSKFRVASLFTINGISEPLIAYAITKGFVFLQESDINGRCNLVLKPIEPIKYNFKQVKYFIYRGLLLDEIRSTVDPIKLLAQGPNLPDLLNKMYQDWPETGTQLLSSTLRLDDVYNALSETTLIDDIFNEEVENQLPFVEGGDTLGKFTIGNPFGVEVLLEEEGFYPTLADVRTSDHIIEISDNTFQYIHQEAFSDKRKREEILWYLDCAAFYGMHYDKKIYYHEPGNLSKISGDVIYNNVVSKFSSKNTIYIDIRNEHQHSICYYDNYRKPANNNIEIKFSISENPDMTSTTVNTDFPIAGKWPILMIDILSINQNSSDLIITMRLPMRDNLNPVLFVPQKCFKDGINNAVFKELNRDENDWAYTESFELELPLFSLGSSYSGISHAVCIYYYKQLDSEYIEELVDSGEPYPQVASVLPQMGPLENLFCPFSIKNEANSFTTTNNPPANTIFWNISPGERFDSWNKLNHMYRAFVQGVASDFKGETAFAFIERSVSANKGIIGFVNKIIKNNQVKDFSFNCRKVIAPGKSFLEAYYDNQRSLLNVKEMVDENNTPYNQNEVESVSFKTVPYKISNPLPPNQEIDVLFPEITTSFQQLTDIKAGDVFSFSYSYSEKSSLLSIITGGSYLTTSPIYFYFADREVLDFGDKEIKDLIKIRLGLRGLNNSGNLIETLTDCFFYSLNNINYFTLAYLNA